MALNCLKWGLLMQALRSEGLFTRTVQRKIGAEEEGDAALMLCQAVGLAAMHRSCFAAHPFGTAREK